MLACREETQHLNIVCVQIIIGVQGGGWGGGGPAAPIGFIFLSGHILAKKHNIRVKTFDIRARGTNIRIKKLHYRFEPGLAAPPNEVGPVRHMQIMMILLLSYY